METTEMSTPVSRASNQLYLQALSTPELKLRVEKMSARGAGLLPGVSWNNQGLIDT